MVVSGLAFEGDEFREIINDFIIESSELLEGLDQSLVDLEERPNDTELLNVVFRSVHTIKGAAGFLGFTQMVETAHTTENILNKMRQGEIIATPSIIDVILNAFDTIKALLNNIKMGESEKELDISNVITQLNQIMADCEAAEPKEKPAEEKKPEKKEPEKPKEKPAEEKKPEKKEPEKPKEKPKKDEKAELVAEVKKSTEKKKPAPAPAPAPPKAKPARQSAPKPKKEKSAPVKASTGAGGRRARRPRKGKGGKSGDLVNEIQQELSRSKKPVHHASSRDTTIRVDIERMDNVMNLVGEMVLKRNRLLKLSTDLEQRYEDDNLVTGLIETVSHLNLITTDLQQAVMKTRMLPIKKIFNKFPRMVRDLARQVGKEIDLQVFGEETELDRSVIEEIGDPLVHLIRNSVDHGVEPPDERESNGKPRQGIIVLSAYHEGSHIIIEIEDDGRGIDPRIIKEKAIENGLLDQIEASRMRDKDAINLIFAPGFSTAEKVSDVSGRGVGMDVVKSNISKLNGIIDIETELNKGSKIKIQLPLTVAIIQALMVEVAGEVYAVPLHSVMETIRLSPDQIKTVDKREVVRLRDSVLTLIRLSKQFDIADNPCSINREDEKLYVVVIDLAERRVGLVVDRLHGQEEAVIKSLGGYLADTVGVAGATITGDGNVVLILDVPTLCGAWSEL